VATPTLAPGEDSRAPSTPTVATVRRALSWVGLGHIVGQSFWFGSLLVLAAMLPPRAFGTVTVGLLMVTAATRLMEAGTRGSIIVARDLSRSQVTTALALNVAAGLALGGIIVFLSGPIASGFAHGGDPRVLRALGLSVVFYAPAIVPLALLEKRFQFKRRASVQAGATITASTIAVLAAVLGASVWALVIRQVLFQALLAILGWVAARRMLPPPAGESQPRRWDRLKRKGAFAFLLFSLTDFIVFNADYLTVGHFTNTTQLGLYSLAFTVAFAPVTQLSAQIGSVLFPAAAASDAETIRRRTIASVRLACLVLLPLIPIAVVLAPILIPAVLGARWQGMVAPFQILVAVGVAHAIVNVIGESLSGTGRIGFRARLNVVWMAGMIGALVILVQVAGIRGAALAHLFLYLPIALAYGYWGMRLLGAEPRQLLRALRPVSGLIALQAVVTVAAIAMLVGTPLPGSVRGALAAGLGIAAAAAAIAVRGGGGALADARTFLGLSRQSA
jgi:O-antigen/teichoic acid export membrane protein